jgi:hypothetical protein
VRIKRELPSDELIGIRSRIEKSEPFKEFNWLTGALDIMDLNEDSKKEDELYLLEQTLKSIDGIRMLIK